MISVAEAHRLIAAVVPGPALEECPWQAAAGRVLAQQVAATFPMPRFTNSAMDGFAVRAADTSAASKDRPVELPLQGVVAAGAEKPPQVQPGQCTQIMTGAPLPEGADSVVIVEHTNGYESDPVQIYRPVAVGDNVRQAGEEVREGDLLLEPGVRLGPGELGTLLGWGLERVSVYRAPAVAVAATGDELVAPGNALKPGQIYNTNLPVLSRLVTLAGGSLSGSAVLPDDPARLEQELAGLLSGADILLTSGGVSMGRFDHLRDVLGRLGLEELFWKVAQRPGGPLLFGRLDSTLVFGLPGNPVSAMIIFLEYVWPVLEQLQGLVPQAKVTAELAAPFPAVPSKHRFLFGQAWLEEGHLKVLPARKLGSHMFTSSLGANCILETPPGETPLPSGERVSLRLLPWSGLAGQAPGPVD